MDDYIRAMSLRRTLATLSLVIVAAGCAGAHSASTAPTPLPENPPSTFIFTTSDARMSRVIDVREGLTKQQVFKAASDYLTDKYSIDVSDLRAGFLMTPWTNSIVRAGAPDLRYRTRLILRVSDDGKQAVDSERGELAEERSLGRRLRHPDARRRRRGVAHARRKSVDSADRLTQGIDVRLVRYQSWSARAAGIVAILGEVGVSATSIPLSGSCRA